MRVSDLLTLEQLGLTLLTPGAELDREVRWVYTTDLLEPAAYLTGGEVVLTSEGWYRTDADCETFAASLAAGGAAALVAGDILLGHVPPALVRACAAHGVPVLAAPAALSYSVLSRTVIERLNKERGRQLAEVLGRHRRLVQALVEGADLGGLVVMLGTDIGRECWALSPAGRVLAGSSETLSATTRFALSAAAHRADRLPAVVDGYTMYPIGRRSQGAGHLVVRGELTGDLEGESAEQTAQLLALGGARRDERRRTEQHLHTELVDLIDRGAAADSVSARLRAARVDPTRPLLVLTATTSGMVRPWDLAADLIESVLDTAPDSRAVIAGGEDGLTVFATTGPDLTETHLAELLRTRLIELEPAALGGRIAFGLSATAEGPTALASALAESRHAAQLASDSPRRLALVTARELDSHLLLLAGVPGEVRTAYRNRLLGPLTDYDTDHGTDLLPTLHAFLESNGAWRTTASALHIHVSTLHYRIQRIEGLTGRDLSTARDRVDLYLACSMSERGHWL
ncbi:helix-turn-helix domain-containing protein [Nocardia camponoti]|uniref:PucR family transcriptional regulator n=1 Tax=Nocardia camponoti TaxID=1616106 RepID=A0A917QFU2_9NOCA|nr:helix-turn-helix domain-containing protein [Nocardia camponoti]GGK48560.1 hypothetical protein GCM10011591_19950 [Nocardia camponoti]